MKKWLLWSVCMLMGAASWAQPLIIDVHRDAYCGCCKDWIRHMEQNGFTVRDHVEPNMSVVKHRQGVPDNLASCHTAVIDGRFVEGHVPADQVKAMLKREGVKGIAVPGMPVGSPGMEIGQQQDRYEVILLTDQGELEVIATYPEK